MNLNILNEHYNSISNKLDEIHKDYNKVENPNKDTMVKCLIERNLLNLVWDNIAKDKSCNKYVKKIAKSYIGKAQGSMKNNKMDEEDLKQIILGENLRNCIILYSLPTEEMQKSSFENYVKRSWKNQCNNYIRRIDIYLNQKKEYTKNSLTNPINQYLEIIYQLQLYLTTENQYFSKVQKAQILIFIIKESLNYPDEDIVDILTNNSFEELQTLYSVPKEWIAALCIAPNEYYIENQSSQSLPQLRKRGKEKLIEILKTLKYENFSDI